MNYPFKYVFIYSIFLLIISLWGHFLSLIFQKLQNKKTKEIQNSSFINKILKSFALGLSSYILLVYLFITIWNFNPFTGYYFFLIFDVVCFIYFYGEKVYIFLREFKFTTIRDNLYKKLMKIRDSEKQKRKLIYIISFFAFIFIIISFFNWQYVWIIYTSSSHYYYDSYIWQSHIYHLLRFNSLNYDMLGSYPAGFVIFVAGVFSGTWNENLESIHYLNKAIPGLILLTNFVLLVLVFWEIFHEKKFIAFLPSLILFTSSYFMYRSFFLIPTTLVSTFTILLLYLIYNKEIPRYYQGFIVGAIILTHPYNGIIIVIAYFGFILYEGFFQKIIHLTPPIKTNLKDIFKRLISSYLLPTIILGVFIATFIVNLLLNIGIEWLDGYLHYFSIDILGNLFLILRNFFYKLVESNSSLLLPRSTEFITLFSNSEDIMSNFLLFIRRSIGRNYIGFFLIVLGIIFPMSKILPKEYHSLIRFSRVFLLITLFIYFSSFLETYISPLFQLIYFVRSIEMNIPVVSFLLGMGIYICHFLYDKLLFFIKEKLKNHQKPYNSSKLVKKGRKIIKLIPEILLYSLLFINIGTPLMTLTFERTFKFNNDYDQFLFTFRTYQDDTMDQFENISLHTCREDTNLYMITKYYFSFDHEYKINHWNVSQLEFEDMITNTTKKNDIIILSDFVTSYTFIQQNISYYGEVIYNQSNIIAVRRTFI